MTVTLDGNSLTHIIETSFSKTSGVSRPTWINEETVDVDDDIWSIKALKITYVVRTDNDMKIALDALLVGHTAVNLTDTDYSINNNVWVNEIVATWEGDANWDYPWKIQITLIKI